MGCPSAMWLGRKNSHRRLTVPFFLFGHVEKIPIFCQSQRMPWIGSPPGSNNDQVYSMPFWLYSPWYWTRFLCIAYLCPAVLFVGL
jgi:hypothetical protein